MDSNWLRFMESPTSINLFPLSLTKKSVALNLRVKSECGIGHIKEKSERGKIMASRDSMVTDLLSTTIVFVCAHACLCVCVCVVVDMYTQLLSYSKT